MTGEYRRTVSRTDIDGGANFGAIVAGARFLVHLCVIVGQSWWCRTPTP
jgi:hypothetical protein